MKAARLLLVLVLVSASAGAPGRSQEQRPPAPETVPPIRVEVDLVNVIFSVTDRRSHLVTGLGPDDFRVYEDGVQQQISRFTSETDLPLRIGLLIDASNSIMPRFQFEQEAAIDFLHTILKPGRDQAFVISFDVTPSLVQDYTDDPQALADAIRSVRAGGGTALNDAIYVACKMKLAEGSGNEVRKMMILLSDGEDSASRVSREEALEMAQRHEVTIFTVSTGAPDIKYNSETARMQNPCKAKGAEGDKVLEYFADSTGGLAYCPFTTIDVGRSFEQIANQLRTQYTLAYVPTNRRRDGSFRHITIESRREQLRIHHRPGYYARLEPAGSERP